jgi:hypothetical protein
MLRHERARIEYLPFDGVTQVFLKGFANNAEGPAAIVAG